MYATVADLIAQFGELEALMLSDRGRNAVIDEAPLITALTDASETIDGYLSRYALPFMLPPKSLRRRCCDIARYYLCGSVTQETQPIRDRYDDALRYLEKVAEGKITLGLDEEGAAIDGDDDLVVFTNANNKVFSRDSAKAVSSDD